jgi:hypothetical protein
MVGIELRRASCRWRVTKPALSIASWVLISTMATFSKEELTDLLLNVRLVLCSYVTPSIPALAFFQRLQNASCNFSPVIR